MRILLIGLLLFLSSHSIRIVAEGWRGRQIARLGENRWKGLYALISALVLGLIVWGFGLAGVEAQVLWQPPRWTVHLAALLTLPAFVLLVAAYVPGSRIKAAVGHPMILGVAIWAFAHLIANGRTHAVVLFGAFFVWAVLDFASARRREPPVGQKAQPGTAARDALVVIIGTAAWALFATVLHGWLIGVRPFG
ncbi:NnrU family protein [Ferribacterium limneticum]|uniref:NnrU family protein n=1 Tax=Ferribacterium limneticum TaxID=76259 RepID=UPI001CF91A07|nr:NnrU family protein [Ferribacterium limneticum]UCV21663.1 NnrU family protein [Ferribacterium limneticum]